ncbi:MAG: hypothetical protein GEU89_21765 [Kiloniellaceae bacterium]|nr:hypothetical protein [Kiloniellaceae bacterium]
MVRLVCSTLDELCPASPLRPHAKLIEHVRDRPGHDLRYAVDSSRIERELDWHPNVNLPDGIRRTVAWYLSNAEWIKAVTSAAYRHWIDSNYGGRNA